MSGPVDNPVGMPANWCWAPLGEIASVELGKMLDKRKHTRGKLLSYLRNSNVRWGSFDLEDLASMFFEEDELERFGLKAGDLIVCEGGEPGLLPLGANGYRL